MILYVTKNFENFVSRFRTEVVDKKYFVIIPAFYTDSEENTFEVAWITRAFKYYYGKLEL